MKRGSIQLNNCYIKCGSESVIVDHEHKLTFSVSSTAISTKKTSSSSSSSSSNTSTIASKLQIACKDEQERLEWIDVIKMWSDPIELESTVFKLKKKNKKTTTMRTVKTMTGGKLRLWEKRRFVLYWTSRVQRIDYFDSSTMTYRGSINLSSALSDVSSDGNNKTTPLSPRPSSPSWSKVKSPPGFEFRFRSGTRQWRCCAKSESLRALWILKLQSIEETNKKQNEGETKRFSLEHGLQSFFFEKNQRVDVKALKLYLQQRSIDLPDPYIESMMIVSPFC